MPFASTCDFCGRSAYAARDVPAAWGRDERVACPTCWIVLVEERCEQGLDEPRDGCKCARCRKPRAFEYRESKDRAWNAAPAEPDPPPGVPEDSGQRDPTSSSVYGFSQEFANPRFDYAERED